MVLTISALLAMVCHGTAAPDPQYQKPNDVVAVEESSASNQCRDSSFSYLGDTDKMVPIADCNNLLALWDPGHFTYQLSCWENSTALADHFFVLAANGSCEFAIKSIDGLDNTIMLGDQDMKDLVHTSIASSRDGVTFETVEGQMNCNSDVANNGESNFEWTIRTPGSVN
ncbi:hypothetical protein J7T55_006238 [Diaporthe amygdali]|uniref:uncharacterized protein n=1 Tax=Phomopsis amygdali TaxID=1214568 RepID=UPI0022FE3329|nr:uncharacterized protein J7T55_006238 [Diaporthe amygdali]KAJ0124895.1 hypothetical protein J7T55_006238 [Diaporthe amygdali]